MSSSEHPSSPGTRIEVVAGSPTPAELAATVIAIEQMLAEEAAATLPDVGSVSRGQKAALLEGVRQADALGTGWGVPSGAKSG